MSSRVKKLMRADEPSKKKSKPLYVVGLLNEHTCCQCGDNKQFYSKERNAIQIGKKQRLSCCKPQSNNCKVITFKVEV